MSALDTMVLDARVAMDKISNYNQAQVDALVNGVSKIIYDNAELLAKMAIDETRLGRFDHKLSKNEGMAIDIANSLKGKKSIGIIAEEPEKGIVQVAHPIGVIASVTPTTNPTVTPLGNGIMALKGRNALIVSPHPRARETTVKTVNFMRQALKELNAPEDLFQVIENPSIELSQELMKACDLVVATGGPGLVKAAYSSGTPAYGVGPGNVQVILDREFDLETAAELTYEGRSYDNGIVCSCQQSLIYPAEVEDDLFAALNNHKITVFSDTETVAKVRTTIFKDGRLDPDLIGQDAPIIAKAAGVELNPGTEVIALKVDQSGAEEILSKEKMMPVMILKSYQTFPEGIDHAVANLNVEGAGHSGGILSNNQEHIDLASEKLPVGRLLVNQSVVGAAGAPINGLNPTLSLGCGSWGNNIISENLTYKHLINISRTAKPIPAVDKGLPWE